MTDVMAEVKEGWKVIEARKILCSNMKIFHDGGKQKVQFRSLRKQDGSCPKLEIKNAEYPCPPDLMLDKFVDQWVSNKRRTAKEFGKGAELVILKNGDVVVEYAKETKKEAETAMPSNTNVIFDPKSKEALDLFNKKVLASNCMWDFDSTAINGTLVYIESDYKASKGKPFQVEMADKSVVAFSSIMEAPKPKIQPYKLADAKVRDSLMLKTVKSKDTQYYKEFIITSFSCDGGSWKVNGVSASALLEKFEFIDGTPCGEMPKAE